MQTQDTTALIHKARNGVQSAWTELYPRYMSYVQGVCRAIVGEDLAEDMTQETFLRVLQNFSYRGDADFKTWLYRVAANVCYDHIRSNAARAAHETTIDELPDNAVDIEDAAISRIDLERLLAMLAPGQRERLIQYDLHGLNHREIAEQVGVTEDTARAHHRQAMKRAAKIVRPKE